MKQIENKQNCLNISSMWIGINNLLCCISMHILMAGYLN